MGKRKRIAVIFLFALLMEALAGCGKKDYVVEYGIDGYVYLPGQTWNAKAIESVKAAGDYLYYTRQGANEISLERVLLSSFVSEEYKAAFADSTVLMRFQDEEFHLPDRSLDQIDFLSLLKGDGETDESGTGDGGLLCWLKFQDFAVDQEQDLYFYMLVVAGKSYNTELAGGIICKQTAEGEMAYCTYLPEILDIAADREGRAYVLTGNGIQVLDQMGGVLGRISTEGYHAEGELVAQELFMDSEDIVFYGSRDSYDFGETYKVVWGEKIHCRKLKISWVNILIILLLPKAGFFFTGRAAITFCVSMTGRMAFIDCCAGRTAG